MGRSVKLFKKLCKFVNALSTFIRGSIIEIARPEELFSKSCRKLNFKQF